MQIFCQGIATILCAYPATLPWFILFRSRGGRYVSPRRQNQDLHVLEEGRIRPDIEATSPVVPVLWPLKNDGWGWSVGHSAAG